MTHGRPVQRTAGLVLAVLLLAPFTAPLLAGDEDERPAYLIYLDPETGKYTTEDPAARETDSSRFADSAAVSPRANTATPPAGSGGPGPALIAGGVVAVIALLAAAHAFRRFVGNR